MPQGVPFQIFGKVAHQGPHLGTLELWRKHAPPASPEKHWSSGRSAMEMAKAWRYGIMPPEVVHALVGTLFERFVPDYGVAEYESSFDEERGSGRNHDLVLFGGIGNDRAIIDIEGKADEPFDGRTVRDLVKGSDGQARRVEGLCRALFARSARDPTIADLRYQLVVGAFAAAGLAERQSPRASVALFLVHEFVNETCSAKNLARNANDLDAFLRTINSGEPALRGSLPGIFGAITPVADATWLAPGQKLLVGKVSSWQREPKQ